MDRLLPIRVSVGLLLALGCSVYGAEDSLVLHLSFDDQAAIGRDSSSYGNPVTTHGDPGWVESGICGGAARLDGVDDYFDFGNPESLHLGTDDFTFEAWIKTDTWDTYVVIIGTGDYGVGYGCFSLSIRKENVLNADYRCRDQDNAIAYCVRQAPPTLPPIINRQPINNGRWHHVVVVADRDYNLGIPRLYRDGVEVTGGSEFASGVLPATSIVVTNSDPLFIGAASPAPQRFYTGLIDEVKIYRRALSAEEVVSHYEATKVEQPPPPPLPEPIALPQVTKLDWQMAEFMISVWGGPTLPATSPEPSDTHSVYDVLPQVLKDANVGVVMCRLDKLELCRQWGFRAMLMGVSPEQAAQLKDDKAVWGYYVKDEPAHRDEYPGLAESVQAFRAADPNHPSYINLCGNYQHRHPIYIDVVKPDILSYDYYQWARGQEWHFPRLEGYRAAALEADIPLICWVLGTASTVAERKEAPDVYVPANMARMRQSVFTSLAYGVKGIQWFHATIVFGDGSGLTRSGEDIKIINGELKRLGPVLVKLRSTDVFHTPPLPNDTRPIPDDYWVQLYGGEWVLGMMKHPDQPDTDYLMLANRDEGRAQKARIEFARAGIEVDRFNNDTGEWQSLDTMMTGDRTRVKFQVIEGDGVLLRLR